MQLWKAAASQKTMARNILSTTSFFQNQSIDWQCSLQRPFLQHWQLIRHHWPVKCFPERDTMRKTKQVIQTKHVPVLLSHAKNSRLTIHNLCKSAIHLDSVYLGVWPSNFNVYCLSNTLPVDPSGSYVSNFARTRSRFNTNGAATVGLSILDTLPVLSYFLPTKPVERTNPQLKLQLRNYSCQAAVRCSLNAPPRSTHYNTGQAWSMPSLAVRDLQLNLNSWLDWKPENSHVLANCNYFFVGCVFLHTNSSHKN